MEPNHVTAKKRGFLSFAMIRALGALHIVRRVINYSFSSKSVIGGEGGT